ncbi:MAG TPA: FAD-dependent oxidoreductase [Mesorhizobium sp.]|jgi:thioredoxin reductase (NADPH)|nr:FAD-dependent oxidoreductase [Mesorhizobium sp.]
MLVKPANGEFSEFGGAAKVRLFGQAHSAEAYAIRDFLMRSVVEFEWIELTCDDDCHEQLGLPELANVRLPVVELPDRARLFAPSLREIADRLGWVTQPRLREYDLSIYGAGPAGLSAAVYAASEGLRVVLIERHAVGGQAGASSMIENYMGFPRGIGGADLAERARQQAVKFGCELLMMREGIKAEFRDNRIYVDMADGSKMVARANICATGVEWRRLDLPNERRFLGVGLYYGAGASEAPMCGGEHVYVVGGGNSAGQAVMHLAEHAARVTMLVRGPDLAASLSTYLIERIAKTPNVEVAYNVEVVALEGDEGLRRVGLMDGESGDGHWIDTRRLFVCIGGVPHTEWAKDTGIARDRNGFLITGPDLLRDGRRPETWSLERTPFFLETSVPGSFAAGDVRHNSVKRVASAVGEGAMAVTFAHRYLAETA